jgi:molecular chaperone IbpA
MVNSIFDDFILNMYPKAGYPFYDVHRNDEGYLLDIALAGFYKEELNVSAENGWVYVKTDKDTDDKDLKPLVKNIAQRNVNVKYRIPEHHKVDSVSFENGILSIWMEKELPDHMKRIALEIQ